MKRWSFLVIACSLLCWAAGALAAEDSALKDLRAKWEAMGNEFKDLTIQQETRMGEGAQKGPMQTTVMRKGEKIRTEMNVQGMTMITIFDGADTWMITPRGAQKIPQMKQQMPDVGPKRTWPEDARLTGTETVSGRECDVIEFKAPKDGATTRLWVERKSPTAVKSKSKQGTYTVEALFSDFRKVQGDYEMGFKCDITMNDKPTGTVTIKAVKINTGLADDVFDPNAAAASKPAQ